MAAGPDVWYLAVVEPRDPTPQGVRQISQTSTPPSEPRENKTTAAADEGAAGPGVTAGDPEAGTPPAAGRGARARALQDNPTALLITLACVVVVVLGMRYAAVVLNPILVALFVVMGLSPALDWLRRRGIPAWLTITIALVGFLAIAAAFIGVLASYVGQLGSRLTVYQDKLAELFSDWETWFAGHGIDATGFLSDMVTPERITGAVSSLLGSVAGAFSNIFLMVMVVLFMLAQVYSFPRKVYARLQLSKRFEQSFREFGEVTRSYLFTKGWLAAIAAILSTGIYYAFGVDFALLWGMVFFVLSFIPNFGFILSLIPPFAVTLLEAGFTRAALVVVVVVVMNTIVDNVIAPRFMSRSVGLSTLAVVLSLIVWAWILGPVGALISIPLTLMVKLLILDSYESTRFLSLFLTGGREMVTAAQRKRRKKRACDPDE
jgi:AI-2 transport protein TqsA